MDNTLSEFVVFATKEMIKLQEIITNPSVSLLIFTSYVLMKQQWLVHDYCELDKNKSLKPTFTKHIVAFSYELMPVHGL